VLLVNGCFSVQAGVPSDPSLSASLVIDQNKGLLTGDEIEEFASDARAIGEEEAAIQYAKKARNDLMQYVYTLKRELDALIIADDSKSGFAKMLAETEAWISQKKDELTAEQCRSQQEFLAQNWTKISVKGADLFA